VIGRILRAFFTIYVVATATFFLVRLLPGSPVDVYINEQVSTYGLSYEEASAQAAALFSFDPNAPLGRQYLDYLIALVQGDFGQSVTTPGTTVLTMIGQYLPWTLFSVGISLVISFALGVFFGMVMAYRRGTWVDHLGTAFGSITQSIPSFLLAIMVIVLFGVRLGWLPIADMRGAYTPGVTVGLNPVFISDVLFHALLPIICYVLTSLGGWMLVMKSSTVQVLGDDYVLVARARGLSDSRIQFQYVGRNAMLPLFTSFMLSIGFVVGGSILVETITRYPGIGMLLYESISSRDYTTIQGVLLLTTISVVLANLLADFLYSTIDPRVRLTGKQD
jgi:peptide/nickel transport system permease protein